MSFFFFLGSFLLKYIVFWYSFQFSQKFYVNVILKWYFVKVVEFVC